MRRVSDVSPAVEELAYCGDDRTLDVVWRASGRAYRFFDVPLKVFQWLLAVKSKGGFITRKIVGHYREERLLGPGETRPDVDLREQLERSVAGGSGDGV